MLRGALLSRGIIVQRERIRSSIRRVDPISQSLRSRCRISRRPYSVPGPNSLWWVCILLNISGTHCQHPLYNAKRPVWLGGFMVQFQWLHQPNIHFWQQMFQHLYRSPCTEDDICIDVETFAVKSECLIIETLPPTLQYWFLWSPRVQIMGVELHLSECHWLFHCLKLNPLIREGFPWQY